MAASITRALVIVCLAGSIGCGSSKKTSGGWGTGMQGGSSCTITPLLTVPWELRDNLTDLPITCAYAGAFDVDVDVTAVGVGTETFTQPCSTNATTGAFQIPLIPGPGSYFVNVFLLDETALILSEFMSPTFGVPCADFATPTVILPVNL